MNGASIEYCSETECIPERIFFSAIGWCLRFILFLLTSDLDSVAIITGAGTNTLLVRHSSHLFSSSYSRTAPLVFFSGGSSISLFSLPPSLNSAPALPFFSDNLGLKSLNFISSTSTSLSFTLWSSSHLISHQFPQWTSPWLSHVFRAHHQMCREEGKENEESITWSTFTGVKVYTWSSSPHLKFDSSPLCHLRRGHNDSWRRNKEYSEIDIIRESSLYWIRTKKIWQMLL